MEITPTKKTKRLPSRDFRQILQLELSARCSKNPRYSLRSFARSLSVEPSALSQMINGKRPITRKMMLRLGLALGLSVQQIKSLSTPDDLPQTESPSFQQLSMDSFAAISDWYHYAILELTYVKDFKSDAQWIAKRLGITKSEANIAIERLRRLELLRISPAGVWEDASTNGHLTHLKPAMSSEAAKKYQAQLLDLSKKALQEIPIGLRNHTSATFCFDPADLAAATKRISEFRRSFAEDFQPQNGAKEVYQIQISFFPITQPSIERNSS